MSKPKPKLTPKKTPAKTRGHRPPVLVAELVAAALVDLSGNVAAVAKRFNVDRSAVSQLIGKHETLQKVCRDAREGMKDNAESALYRAVLAGESWAVCFYLKTQAKDRGYIERNETEHTGVIVRITERIIDAPIRIIEDHDLRGSGIQLTSGAI